MIPESFSQLTTDLEAELYRLHYTQATTTTIAACGTMWAATFLESKELSSSLRN
ncbi:hypothetical protein [Acidithrix ferrooxidans]|uniref:Uncharacterized protein n=1 Tax=Acidithrix ferrooxidans TaxID=1280514 RepID=A0A0D8HC06_9ACTN|nr:hypothetical protein [Acidithrix ferrooxidans]KJF15463.1 hypothetical protein AXFE_36930 [Acidithrix ferrooxidans]